ncbi:Pimeloyl-ACP methyl ester carboxylesterase [Cribrihabitans marinus]|uniref:Pimeloyl-ACP methyl ester carboxylesterase n=1 Tax=Cribrihabitans marinus TaxID=1227549 RepID=A0A1H6REY3_9RHOB|nr:adenylate/guanylate cyclase domain-containing protein [Cribrihabitans marinus]GGH20838.1 hydrolase [Cribrihabitans marinus]SEI53016.1 Pimeloyl-ACP methyl ester carboxylesterase [Cribrihabitans marinus]
MAADRPETRFTLAGDVSIAYQVFGDGPVDLVYASGWLHNIDVAWEHPGYAAFLNRLAERCRLILFDKRGTGMSDRNVGAPTLEERAEDIRAVMDAAGSERAALFGVSEGGNMTTMFAATYPERVSGVVLIGCFPCRAWKPDWPDGRKRDAHEADMSNLRNSWGDFSDFFREVAPTVADDPQEQAFMNRLLVQSGSPSSAVAITRLNYEIDIRALLPSVQAPALVLHMSGDRAVDLRDARYLAEAMPNSELRILERDDHLPWVGDPYQVSDQILNFVAQAEVPVRDERVLATILVTDIVGSTERAAKLGDAGWKQLIESHDSAARRAVSRHDGDLVKWLGDGLMATFAGPSRAVAAARAIREDAAALGLQIRSGVHTGECLRRQDDVTGLAVTISQRIADGAGAEEIRVSGTVRDLVVGSGLEFETLAPQTLKGVPGEWPLFRLQS